MSADRAIVARRVALAVPAAALAGAYGFQFFGGLAPCEMCWWQRYAHFAALALALAAFVLPAGLFPGRRGWTMLAGLALAGSALIGGYQAGVEYGWWQGLTECTSTVHFAAGQDPLQAIMAAPLVRCDVVQWSLLGISLAGFNFLFSGIGALAVFAGLATARKGAA